MVDHVAEPRVGADRLRDDEGEPGDAEALAQPDQCLGECAGDHHVPDPLRPAQAHRVRGLAGLAVDAPDPREGVQVEGERDAHGDQGQLRRLPDAHPDDEERDQAEVRQRAQHLHGRVERVLADPAEAGDDGQDQAERGADREADPDPLDRDEGGGAEGPVPDEVGRRGGDLLGGGDGPFIDRAGAAERLPERDEDDR